AKTAQSYVWSHAHELGIDPNLVKTSGVHIHVPAGAGPEGGPSAGGGGGTAPAAPFSGVPPRGGTPVAGGRTPPGAGVAGRGAEGRMGGVKEKVLAARRAGMKRVVLPKDNEKDAKELPENVRKEIELIFAERIDEVLAATLPQLVARTAPTAAS